MQIEYTNRAFDKIFARIISIYQLLIQYSKDSIQQIETRSCQGFHENNSKCGSESNQTDFIWGKANAKKVHTY